MLPSITIKNHSIILAMSVQGYLPQWPSVYIHFVLIEIFEIKSNSERLPIEMLRGSRSVCNLKITLVGANSLATVPRCDITMSHVCFALRRSPEIYCL